LRLCVPGWLLSSAKKQQQQQQQQKEEVKKKALGVQMLAYWHPAGVAGMGITSCGSSSGRSISRRGRCRQQQAAGLKVFLMLLAG
jgi:hypothetical protein